MKLDALNRLVLMEILIRKGRGFVDFVSGLEMGGVSYRGESFTLLRQYFLLIQLYALF